MLLKYFYDPALAHASYLVGCQRDQVALIVDPGRDVEHYIQAARREGMTIIGVAETHIHADYVSGARELAARAGAKLYVSDEGPADWKYLFLDEYQSQPLKDGDTFMLGNIKFETMHTPGHTPESISFVLTDQGGGADKPMGVFTGDFVFVGSIGRPDLLEEAAGVQGSAAQGAHELFHSLQRFKQLPDYLQVWPAHGAGSACGKGLGAIPSSTVGYEKLFNPGLQYTDEEAFVKYILSDQPEAPKYFAVMKRVNKEGPELLSDWGPPKIQEIAKLKSVLETATVVDLSPVADFAKGHVPGTINIPLSMLAGWAGWLLDYSKPVYLLGAVGQLPEAARVLRKIGVDHVQGAFAIDDARAAGLTTETYETAAPREIVDRITSEEVRLIDVRSDVEWNEGRIAQAEHRFLGRLADHLDDLPRDKPIVAQCLGGGRSAIAASVLQAAGFQVINLTGGYRAWRQAGLPTTATPAPSAAHATS